MSRKPGELGALGKLILYGVAVGLAVAWGSLGGVRGLLGRTDTRLGLSMRYDVPQDAVTIERMPTDCDFLHAPIGDKSCHYEAQITLQLIQNEHVHTSVDGGKTWVEPPYPLADKDSRSTVELSWNNVED